MSWLDSALGWVGRQGGKMASALNPVSAYHKAFDPKKADPAMMASLPHGEEDRARIGGYMGQQSPWQTGATTSAATVGHDPNAGNWGQLIGQLQDQARGIGPSVAQNAYRQASQDSMGNLASLAHGSMGAGAARQALIQQGLTGQGMAQGLANARTQEQLGAMGQLTGALGASGQAAFQRDALNAQNQQSTNNLNAQLAAQAQAGNQDAWLKMLAAQLGISEQQLRAQLGNQQYDLGVSGQPTGAERALGALGGFAAGIAKL